LIAGEGQSDVPSEASNGVVYAVAHIKELTAAGGESRPSSFLLPWHMWASKRILSRDSMA
jgi:hypothetical protein